MAANSRLGALIYEDPVHSLLGTGLACVIGLLYWATERLRRSPVVGAA